MTAPRLALGSTYALNIVDGQAVIRRKTDDVVLALLSRLEAVTAGLLNGTKCRQEVMSTMFRIAGDVGQRTANTCLVRLRPLLVESEEGCRTDLPELDALAQVANPNRRDAPRTLPGPRVLHWWVTNACPRRCVYCFANPDHTGQTEPRLIERRRLQELFQEAASLGAEQLLVAGGEPFLRGDLPEVLSDAIASGIEPAITTKFPLTAELATRLSAAGLKHICLSVDSVKGATNQSLLGSASFGSQVDTSIRALKAAGIEFSVEFVATSLNHAEMEEVCAWANAHEAIVFLIVPFEPVLNPIGQLSNVEMMVPDSADLPRRIAALDAQFSRISVEAFEDLENQSDAPNCDIGKTKLFFDPFGRVHRCYKLLHEESLFGPDLRTVGVAEAWHDTAFNSNLLAPKDKYAKGSCGSCGAFDACHDDGRCIFQSHLDYQTYHDKDRRCDGPYAPTG